jgi:hypothetical protein
MLEQELRKLGNVSPRGNTVTCHRAQHRRSAAADLLGDLGIGSAKNQEPRRLAEPAPEEGFIE